jgi:hypothetical protein
MSCTRSVLVTALALLLAACASAPYAQRTSERQSAYANAAGAPVRQFHFFSLYSWEPLGNHELAVYTRPNEAWLLDVDDGCYGLEYAQAIGLTSSLGQVMVRFDRVLTGYRNFPCTIVQIRPVDVKKLKAVQQQQRQIRSEQRSVDKDAAGH